MFEKWNFGTDFQDLLLASIIQKPEKFMHNVGTLNSAYFYGVERIAAARALFAYWRKNHKFPATNALCQVVYDSIVRTPDAKEENNIIKYVDKLRDMDTANADCVVEHVVAFARERALLIAIEKSHEFLVAGETPPGGYGKMFQDALKIGQNLEDVGYRLKSGEDNDINRMIDKVTAKQYGTPTGFADLDTIWPFGWGPGWLVSILAPPKRYKTAFCINLAMNIIEEYNSPVIYYPCEISQELAALRCLCNLTGQPTDELFRNRESFRALAHKVADEHFKSTLLIKGFPARSATIGGEIRSHALTAASRFNLKPKAIIIDFAETVKAGSTTKTTSEWRAQGEIYVEARALGAELGCPVIMPDRCNKETVGKRVPSMKSFQGSFEKAGIVDVAIGLCASDDEYVANQIRYFVFLNRHGAAYQHYRGTIVPTTMRMTIDERIPYNPDLSESEDQ
jgi:replicative DNA helicase